MGKTLGTLFAAILMTGGLTAATIGGAQADHGGYTPHVDTNCSADNLNNPRVGNPAKVRFRASTAGNVQPRGRVSFKYERRSNGVVVQRYNRRYDGSGWERYRFLGLPRGKYVVRVVFNPSRATLANSRDRFRQTVRPRR